MEPYWYTLISDWVNNYGGTGLSIPFVVGVESIFINKAPPCEKCIENLLDEIVSHHALEQCVTLNYCSTIEAYILGLTDRAYINAPFFRNKHNESTLILLDNVFRFDSSIREIAEILNECYWDDIKDGNYSRATGAFGTWRRFSTEELTQIEYALSG